MRHEHDRTAGGGRRETLVAVGVVGVGTAVAAVLLFHRGGGAEGLRPQNETAVAVQAYVRRARPAAVVTACTPTAARATAVGGRVWRCTVRSPGSGYRATLCVTLTEDVVRAVAAAVHDRCVERG